MSGRAVVAGLAHAVPAPMRHEDLWREFFAGHFAGTSAAAGARIWAATGISTRHGVVDPRVEDVTVWGTAARMQRFASEAPRLGKEAVASALDVARLAAGDVGLFAVVSCTGYTTPGLDILLARDLGMPADVQRLHIGHMGCYAAIPGLGAVGDFVAARGRPAVLLCVELPSLHAQPADGGVGDGSGAGSGSRGSAAEDAMQQLVAHALFADAASAVVVLPEPGRTSSSGGRVPSLELVDVAALTDSTTLDYMTWDVTDAGFRMGLSPRVPDVLAKHVRHWVAGLLARHGLTLGDVAGWAVHPGGRRIVEVVGEQLGLPAAALAPSFGVLEEFGNCSSPTVLLVLERLLEAPPGGRPLGAGQPVVAMAFGPGLTLYAALLRVTGD